MKSEKNQVQESNFIADKIEAFLIKTKRSLPAILAAIVIGLIALVSYGIYQSVSYSQAAKGWTALYFSDTDAADLESIADDFGSNAAGHWARQAAGDSHLAKGVEFVFVNRDIAEGHYKNAIAEYEKITSKSGENFLLSRAYFGLAQAKEGLADREGAIENYRKIIGLRGIDSEFQSIATKRADWLESKQGEGFFTWFAENRQAAPAIVPPMGERPALPTAPTIEFSSPASPASPETPAEVEPAKAATPAENATQE